MNLGNVRWEKKSIDVIGVRGRFDTHIDLYTWYVLNQVFTILLLASFQKISYYWKYLCVYKFLTSPYFTQCETLFTLQQSTCKPIYWHMVLLTASCTSCHFHALNAVFVMKTEAWDFCLQVILSFSYCQSIFLQLIGLSVSALVYSFLCMKLLSSQWII